MFRLELPVLEELRQHRHRCRQTITVDAVLAVVQIQQRTSVGRTRETIRIREEQEKLENQRTAILLVCERTRIKPLKPPGRFGPTYVGTKLLVQAVKQM